MLYYVYNGERYDKTIKITRTSRLGLCLYSTVSNPSYYYRTGDIMKNVILFPVSDKMKKIANAKHKQNARDEIKKLTALRRAK